MNSPSRALIWELCWKNRWGFALMGVLLIAFGGLRLYVSHLNAEVRLLEAEFQRASTGSLSFRELMPQGAGAGSARAQIKLDSGTAFEGMVRPDDRLSWSGSMPNGTLFMMDLNLNGNPILHQVGIFHAEMSVSVLGGGKRSISFAVPLERAEAMSPIATTANSLRAAGLTWGLVALGFSVLVMFAIFGVAEPHPARGFTGLPPRQFTLPVPTGMLIFWPVVLGAGAILLLSFVWTGLIFPGFLLPETPILHLYYALLLACGLVGFQALVWSLPAFPKTRVFLLTLLVLGMVFIVALPSEPGAADALARSRPIWAAAYLVLWVLGAMMAWQGVTLERRGRWLSWTRSALLARRLGSFQLQSFAFGSPLQAQFWMEWRRNGRLPFLIWLGLVAFVMGAQILSKTFWPVFAPTADSLVYLGEIGAGLWVTITGLNLARDGATKRLAMSTFTASRPIRTGTLVLAKLLVAAVLWFGGLGVLAAGTFVTLTALGGFDHLPDPTGLLVLVALFIPISLHFLAGILPVCLSGRMPGFPWSMAPVLIIYGLIGNVLFWFGQHPEFSEFVLEVLVFLLLTKFALAFWGFRQSVGLQLTSGGFVLGYSLLWVVATALLVCGAWWLAARSNWPPEGKPLILVAALMVPLARIALASPAVAMNRHR